MKGSKTMNLNDISIPTAALAIDGVTPEVGDEVEVTVRGRVSEAAGGNTFITPTEANGVPFPVAPTGLEELPPDLSEEELREAAKAYDEEEPSPFPM